MPDTPEIPAHLIDLQRAYDTAHTGVLAASRHPGRIADWPADAVAELEEARTVEREAAVALHRARAGTAFEAWEGQRRVQDAARAAG